MKSEDRLEAWPATPTGVVPIDDIPCLLPAAAGGGSAAPATFTQIFADTDRGILVTLQTQPAGVQSTPIDRRRPVTVEGGTTHSSPTTTEIPAGVGDGCDGSLFC